MSPNNFDNIEDESDDNTGSSDAEDPNNDVADIFIGIGVNMFHCAWTFGWLLVNMFFACFADITDGTDENTANLDTIADGTSCSTHGTHGGC